MIPKILKLRFAGCGPNVSKADVLKATRVTIGGTLAIVLALMWALVHYGKNDYLLAFLTVSWIVPDLYSKRYTTLKGRPGRTQAVLIAGPAAIAIGIVLAAIWITHQ